MATTARPSAQEIGLIAHRAIADLLTAGVRRPDTDDLLSVTRCDLIGRAPVYRQAIRQQVLTAVAVYFRAFPVAAGTRFVDSEVAVPGGRLDLLFEEPDGRLWSDEVKAGRCQSAAEVIEVREQLERHLKGAREVFGEKFAGARAVLLSRPAASFVLIPDGTFVPVTPDVSDAEIS